MLSLPSLVFNEKLDPTEYSVCDPNRFLEADKVNGNTLHSRQVLHIDLCLGAWQSLQTPKLACLHSPVTVLINLLVTEDKDHRIQ